MQATTTDVIEQLQSLYSAVVADVLDSMGYRKQVLGFQIQALTPANQLCGRVFTARAVAVDHMPAEPYKLEMEAVDRMQSGDVFVVDAGYNTRSAFWGELLTTACQAKGVRGVVMSTCLRDRWSMNRLPFPVFGIGCTPADSAGRSDVISIGEPIVIDDVSIRSGDYILGDLDGVVVLPQQATDEALRRALAKVSGENTVREELRAGVPVADVFRKHGVL